VTRGLRVVALGGGHGLGATLRALRRASPAAGTGAGLGTDAAVPGGIEITAVVTVADNGGSSGRLRREFALVPPGDLRMAFASLLEEDPGGWAALLQHRFSSAGPLDGHALGNLLLVAAWEQTRDPVAALDLVGKLLGVPGRVLPMCSVPLDIAADVQPRRGRVAVTVRGQAEVAVARGRIRRVWLEPPEPPACPAAVTAIGEADWVVLGPGSWFTSVLPHLLVPQLRDAITGGPARVVLVLNLDPGADETAGYPAAEHLQVLRDHAPGLAPDVVLADPSSAGPPGSPERAALASAVAAAGGDLVVAELAERDPATGAPLARHDSVRFAAALTAVFGRPDGTAPGTAAPAGTDRPMPRVAGSRSCR